MGADVSQRRRRRSYRRRYRRKSKKPSKKRSRRSRKNKSCKSKREEVKKVEVFYNDVDDNYMYTYKRKTTEKDRGKVIKAIEKAMIGFCNVKVTHMKDNIYTISSNGPDERTSNEARNLNQMGEFTDFTVRLKRN